MEENNTIGYGYRDTKGFSIIAPFTPSGKFRVRIWRPDELDKLIKAIPKPEYRTMFEFTLYTGMRYIESQLIKDYPELFEDKYIHLIPGIAAKKPKCTIKDRYVKLNPVGIKVAEDYFKLKKKLPNINTWRENVTRWCKLAKIDSNYISVKSSRKTWESYLMSIYPLKRDEIFISQGHSELTALKSYINLPFTESNKDGMIKYVAGW